MTMRRVRGAVTCPPWPIRLVEAARDTPQRVALVDGELRLDCRDSLRTGQGTGAGAAARMPAGSVVSFMLPNWHEAAVVYLAATLAGMVVNPILPSLRDRELRFILDDVDSRMIFMPASSRQHDYAAMLDRVDVADGLAARGRRGARRARRPHRRTPTLLERRRPPSTTARARPGRGADDPLHLGHHRAARKAFCTAITRSTR